MLTRWYANDRPTDGYGQASREFANGEPLELIDGGNLLYLLEEHADIEAKIEPPEDWVDPEPDQDWTGPERPPAIVRP